MPNTICRAAAMKLMKDSRRFLFIRAAVHAILRTHMGAAAPCPYVHGSFLLCPKRDNGKAGPKLSSTNWPTFSVLPTMHAHIMP